MENCYFWIKDEVSEPNPVINVLCVQCRDKNHPKLGWFWEGSKLGYGPFDFICGDCGFVIHAHQQDDNLQKKRMA